MFDTSLLVLRVLAAITFIAGMVWSIEKLRWAGVKLSVLIDSELCTVSPLRRVGMRTTSIHTTFERRPL
jgi:hypothetical protein